MGPWVWALARYALILVTRKCVTSTNAVSVPIINRADHHVKVSWSEIPVVPVVSRGREQRFLGTFSTFFKAPPNMI